MFCFYKLHNDDMNTSYQSLVYQFLSPPRCVNRYWHIIEFQERLPKALLWWRLESGKRQRGRCYTWWRNTVKWDVRLAGVESVASDRSQWWDVLALLVSWHHVAEMTMMPMPMPIIFLWAIWLETSVMLLYTKLKSRLHVLWWKLIWWIFLLYRSTRRQSWRGDGEGREAPGS